jgi:predicted amidophosphoribosyltransferase
LQLIVISKSLILKFKHADRLELTTIVSTLLSPAFNQLCNPDTLVIPIPLHPARYRKLMFNQSSEIARSLCKTYECTPLYQPSLLERVVNTEQLGRMRRSQRAKTLKGVFTINHQKQNLLISKSCLPIDDVITTGSTISEAAKKLLSAGALQVNALCFASAR